jgi:hypothetical protein
MVGISVTSERGPGGVDVARRRLGSDRATSEPRFVERDSRLDDSALSGGRAHLKVSPEQPRALAHPEQTKVLGILFDEDHGVKALPIVGDGKCEFFGSERNCHQQVACTGVAKRVSHGLLSDTKGAEFNLRGKACLGPNDPEFGVRLGFVFDIGDETRKCGDESKLVKGRRAQVSRESPQSGGSVQ